MLKISQSVINDIVSYTQKELPFESCGVITSLIKCIETTTFHPITNVHQHARHFFEFDKQQWIDINLKCRLNNEYIICYVHSHFLGTAHLSEEDIKHITDHDAYQLIVHYIEKNSPTFHLYRYNKRSDVYESCPLMFT